MGGEARPGAAGGEMRPAAAALAALSGILAVVLPVSAQRSAPDGTHWILSTQQPPGPRLRAEIAALQNLSWEPPGLVVGSGNATIRCGDAKLNTDKLLEAHAQGGVVEQATEEPTGLKLWGEYFSSPPLVLINDALLPTDMQGTLIHEAQHWVGISSEDVADAAILCFPGATEEEEDENEDDNDGNTGSGGGGGRIVSKRQHYTTPGVWVIVWIPPRNTGGGHVGEVTVVCDYDPDTWWPDCPDMEEEEEN